jgi:hypothetical protein
LGRAIREENELTPQIFTGIYARTVSEKLRLNLSGAQADLLSQHRSVKPEAYELVLKGKYSFRARRYRQPKKGRGLFEQAVCCRRELCARLCQPFGNISTDWQPTASLIRGNIFQKPRLQVGKLLSWTENLPDAHLTMGNIYQYNMALGRCPKREYINAGSSSAQTLASGTGLTRSFFSLMGRHEEALAEAQRGERDRSRRYDGELRASATGLSLHVDLTMLSQRPERKPSSLILLSISRKCCSDMPIRRRASTRTP